MCLVWGLCKCVCGGCGGLITFGETDVLRSEHGRVVRLLTDGPPPRRRRQAARALRQAGALVGGHHLIDGRGTPKRDKDTRSVSGHIRMCVRPFTFPTHPASNSQTSRAQRESSRRKKPRPPDHTRVTDRQATKHTHTDTHVTDLEALHLVHRRVGRHLVEQDRPVAAGGDAVPVQVPAGGVVCDRQECKSPSRLRIPRLCEQYAYTNT